MKKMEFDVAVWPPMLQCQVCGEIREAKIKDGRVARGEYQRCWRGCTIEELKHKLAQFSEAFRWMKIERRKANP